MNERKNQGFFGLMVVVGHSIFNLPKDRLFQSLEHVIRFVGGGVGGGMGGWMGGRIGWRKG